MAKNKKVIKHLKSDIKTFKHEAEEDRKLIKSLKMSKPKKHHAKKHHSKKKEDKIEKVMHEYKEHKLHSGSKKGPKVKKRSQAIAIALSEARKAGEKQVSKPKKKVHKKKK